MEIPDEYHKKAAEVTALVINGAVAKLGNRRTLNLIADVYDTLEPPPKVPVDIKSPVAIKAMKLIHDTIANKWNLKNAFAFCIKPLEHLTSVDYTTLNIYYEVIFSQPTIMYPIPQETASVFFRVQELFLSLADENNPLKITFRLEGHYVDHDIRYVILQENWILGILQMKRLFFRRLEQLEMF